LPKVLTSDQKVELYPAKNGWVVHFYEWDRAERAWICIESYVYQDYGVLMEVLQESLKE